MSVPDIDVTETKGPFYLKGLAALTFGCGVLTGWVLRGNKSILRAAISKKSLVSPRDCKLALVVRNDLKMGKGKMCSQCSHASVIAVKNLKETNPVLAELWEKIGQAKVVLQTDSEQSLLKLAAEANENGLLANIVTDAGRTQIATGTKTVLAVGPGN